MQATRIGGAARNEPNGVRYRTDTGGEGAWNQWLHVENIESFGWMSPVIS